MRKVQRGDSLSIPAETFNTFIDAARDFKQRQANVSSGSTPAYRPGVIILVKNVSGSDVGRSAVLGLGEPVILPSSSEREFLNRVALKGETPTEESHAGRFAVTLVPLNDGETGQAYVSGVFPVKVNVEDEEHGCADLNEGETGSLESSSTGQAQILWKEEGTGEKWAVVHLGPANAKAGIFPVSLSQTGGTQGDDANPAMWTYDVADALTGDDLGTGFDPTASPHHWKRPAVGQMIAADFGYAHFEDDESTGEQTLVLGWINEMVDQESCTAQSEG